MKNYVKLLLLSILILSCNTETKNKQDNTSEKVIESVISKIKEENYDIVDNENVFKSGTIENFDREGQSIDVYWIGKEKDTILKFKITNLSIYLLECRLKYDYTDKYKSASLKQGLAMVKEKTRIFWSLQSPAVKMTHTSYNNYS